MTAQITGKKQLADVRKFPKWALTLSLTGKRYPTSLAPLPKRIRAFAKFANTRFNVSSNRQPVTPSKKNGLHPTLTTGTMLLADTN